MIVATPVPRFLFQPVPIESRTENLLFDTIIRTASLRLFDRLSLDRSKPPDSEYGLAGSDVERVLRFAVQCGPMRLSSQRMFSFPQRFRLRWRRYTRSWQKGFMGQTRKVAAECKRTLTACQSNYKHCRKYSPNTVRVELEILLFHTHFPVLFTYPISSFLSISARSPKKRCATTTLSSLKIIRP